METLYVDKDTGQIALERPRVIRTRRELFDLGRFSDMQEAADESHLCPPLRYELDSLHFDLFEKYREQIEVYNSENKGEADIEEYPAEAGDTLTLLAVVSGEPDPEETALATMNEWLEGEPDGEDWEHGDETADPYFAAFRRFENSGIPEGLNMKLVEGFHPGDNSQVAVLNETIEEANSKSDWTGLQFVTL